MATMTEKLFTSSTTAGQEACLPLLGDEAIRFVWCPAGEFEMGSPDDDEMAERGEKPQHRVELTKGFWLARTPVTQYQWEIVMGQCPRLWQSGWDSLSVPAEGMSWTEAISFCHKLTESLRAKRQLTDQACIYLPTEAQWEYACRAGTKTRWCFGNNEDELENHAWYDKNSGDLKHPVGTKAPNPWGLFDMYGNISEWCLDDYHMYHPKGECEVDPAYVKENGVFKILRGGSFAHLAEGCRSASREMMSDENPFNEPTGLRVVCIELK